MGDWQGSEMLGCMRLIEKDGRHASRGAGERVSDAENDMGKEGGKEDW